VTAQDLDALADDYVARVRRGEQPSIDAYATRHPALAGEIRALFPVLAAVEGAAPRAEREPEFPGLEIRGAHVPGAGGMGVVYQARERSLDRIVAVKTTRAHLDTPEGRAFFENEARAAARLDHPHIVRVFSFDPAHRPPYYVMQWIDGLPLHDACRDRPPRAIAELLEKVTRALDYAHGQRVVHRDIKPQNVLVDAAGEPHITDFGLAERIDTLLREPAGARDGVRGTFYWGDLSRWQRVAALAVPCLLINAAGWMYHARGSRLNAVVFLSTGSLLWPMLVAVVLAEYRWLAPTQTPARELLGVAAVLPRPGAFVLTNAQINAVAAAFLGYALVLLRRVRTPLFAAWTGAGIQAAYTAALLPLGLREWLDTRAVALALVSWLACSLAFVPIAGVVRRRGRAAWSAIFYAFFPLPCALLLTLLARFGGEEWLGCRDWHDRGVQLWLLANGLVYLALGRAHARATTGYQRAWGELFLLLVPISLLVPNHVLLEDPPFLGAIGAHPVSLWELGALLISAALVLVGTRARRIALVAPGVCGLAVALVRSTERHFAGVLAWPLALAAIGGAAMVAGAVSIWVRARRSNTPR
jgi:hypothetical protein